MTDTCWLWTGATTGKLKHGSMRRRGEHVYPHVLMWELWVGPVPAGKNVCHHCDVPTCVRPDHLFVGTQRENLLDCVNKGRSKIGWKKGEDHPRVKFSDKQVAELRRRYSMGEKVAPLAREFGMSYSHAMSLCKGDRRG